jgi:hypothetical protein
MRFLNLCVVAMLVFAAAYVYEIKFETTLRAERIAKMRGDIRRERDAIAALRAEWAMLENPARLQGLVRRHLTLGPTQPAQFDSFDRLPERAPQVVQPPQDDAIASMIENPDGDGPTGSIPEEGPPPGTLPGRDERD